MIPPMSLDLQTSGLPEITCCLSDACQVNGLTDIQPGYLINSGCNWYHQCHWTCRPPVCRGYLLTLLIYAKAMDLSTFSLDNRLKYKSPIKIVIAILPAIGDEDCKLPESSGSAGIFAAGVQHWFQPGGFASPMSAVTSAAEQS